MNFKSIGLAGLAAATLMSAATVTATPANASSIAGSKLVFGGVGKFTTATGKLNFSPRAGSFSIPGLGSYSGKGFGRAVILNDGSKDGSKDYFDGRFAEQFRVKDLKFNSSGTNAWTLALAPGKTFIDEFFKFKDGVTFDLSTFGLTKQANGGLIGNYTGTFKDAQGNPFFGSDGSFTAFNDKFTTNAKGDGYSSSITPIPTPALLPGLLGLGVAALRKRKSEESGVEAAETAKA